MKKNLKELALGLVIIVGLVAGIKALWGEDKSGTWSQDCPCGIKLTVKGYYEDDYSFTCAKCGRLYAHAWIEPEYKFVVEPNELKIADGDLDAGFPGKNGTSNRN